MAATRRKAPSQAAPQTIGEATELLGRYAGIITEAERLRADADAAKAAIDAARDTALAPIEQQARAIFMELRAWWGVAGGELTEGKRKSVELAGCLIGIRTTPPSLTHAGMKVGEAIAKIEELAAQPFRDGGVRSRQLRALLRIKTELDKPAIIKVVSGDDDLTDILEGAGFGTRQKEEFFIDRAADKSAAVEEVREEAA